MKVHHGKLLDRWIDRENKAWMTLQTSGGEIVRIRVPDKHVREVFQAWSGATVVNYIDHDGQAFYISPDELEEIELRSPRETETSEWEASRREACVDGHTF